ncbi:phage tail fiber protein [Streptomyces sp. enrichment culture]|uniref:phage tail fiber protein n=1 Tax=Streptomyces sp. enrichment culture TaxID=1795815 RepID=UPI003F5767A1
MANNLTDTGENRTVDWLFGSSTTAPTLPLKMALVTAAGSDSAAGTEVTGGSYARKNISVAAAVNGAVTNSADLSFTGMPACTVVGWEIWDSAGTPVRWSYGPFDPSKMVAAGDEFKVVAGGWTFSAS